MGTGAGSLGPSARPEEAFSLGAAGRLLLGRHRRPDERRSIGNLEELSHTGADGLSMQSEDLGRHHPVLIETLV